jgi:RNA polymerase sigma-70 factor (ECF subfamily)
MLARRPRPVDESDEALMLRAGTGDRLACDRLVERHLGRIVTFARSDAEDAAQDVFLRVWSAAPRWRMGAARFSTWLHRVAMNVCLDRIARKREAPVDDLPELADPRPEPSAALHTSEVGRHVVAALAALPETQRMAVTLCHYQGFRNREAAEVMGVSVQALESLLARGRRALQMHLRPVAAVLMGND